MQEPKVGLITFGDAREHEWEKLFRGLTVPRHEAALSYFSRLPIELCAAATVARQREEIDAQVAQLQAAGVEALVAHVPCWTSPNLVVRGIQALDLPTVLLSNKDPETHGTVGFLGAGGALDQIGFPHLRVREQFEGEKIAEKVMPLFRAAAASTRLQGMMFGLFGGRSLGIDTGTFDPMQWRSQFGVDAEHIDQLEIIRRAEHVAPEQAEAMVDWLEANTAGVQYNDEGLTRDRLAYQARCYLATKEIVDEMGLDFIAVKCMPDLTTHYVPQCLTAAFLPGPYDAEGEKAPVMMACEADGDAALTMEILKQISGGKPVLFMDVSYIDDETLTFYLPNCGAQCTWYAARAEDPAENLRQVEIRPAMRPGGGGITYFTSAPGPLTLARLTREDGEYQMTILKGKAIELPEDKYEAFVQARGKHQLPTAFVQADVDVDAFLAAFGSNHILGVAGNYVEELGHFCQLLGISAVTYETGAESPGRKNEPARAF